MNAARLFEHLKRAQQQQEEDHKLRELQLIKKEIESSKAITKELIDIQEKKNELLKIKHETEVDNLKTEWEVQRLGYEQEYKMLEHEKEMLDLAHQEEVKRLIGLREMEAIMHKNDKLVQELDFRETTLDLNQRIYEQENRIEEGRRLLTMAEERMGILREQNVLENKKGQIKDQRFMELQEMERYREEYRDRDWQALKVSEDIIHRKIDIEKREAQEEIFDLKAQVEQQRELLDLDRREVKLDRRINAANAQIAEKRVSLAKTQARLYQEVNRALEADLFYDDRPSYDDSIQAQNGYYDQKQDFVRKILD